MSDDKVASLFQKSFFFFLFNAKMSSICRRLRYKFTKQKGRLVKRLTFIIIIIFLMYETIRIGNHKHGCYQHY